MRKLPFLLSITILLSGCGLLNRDQTLPSVPTGSIKRIYDFKSDYIDSRFIDIWMPEGYNTENKYSVIYVQDGQMLFDSSVTYNHQEWGIDETISKLTGEGLIEECIVVGIWNSNANRHSDYFPKKPFKSLPKYFQDSLLHKAKRYGELPLYPIGIQSDNYLKFLVHELKPYIDKNYSTNSGMRNTFIAGASMGGLISMYAICEYPEIFGGAASMSTHWTGTFTNISNPIPEAIINYMDSNLPDPANHKIYFDLGTITLDSLYGEYQIMADSVMIKNGFTEANWNTVTFPGDDHTERSWRKRLHIPISFFLGKE